MLSLIASLCARSPISVWLNSKPGRNFYRNLGQTLGSGVRNPFLNISFSAILSRFRIHNFTFYFTFYFRSFVRLFVHFPLITLLIRSFFIHWSMNPLCCKPLCFHLSELLWTAPEHLRNPGLPLSQPADVYSYGIILQEILLRDLPYSTFEYIAPEGNHLDLLNTLIYVSLPGVMGASG